MGSVKCSQAIENSIAEDCFDVPNIEEIFKSTLSSVASHDSISPNYEIPEDKKLEQNLEESNKDSTTFESKSNTKEEAKDFLGPLRNGFLSTSIAKSDQSFAKSLISWNVFLFFWSGP